MNIKLSSFLLLTFFAVAGNVLAQSKQAAARPASKTTGSGLSGLAAVSSARACDSDVLDMDGDWKVTQEVPSFTWIYRIHLTRIGPNTYGGQRFEGYLIGFPTVGTFYVDTFYGGRGVQLVQMRFEENTSCGRYYKLLSGKHQINSSDPTRVEVLGGWVDGGYAGAASGYHGSFVMVKD